MAQYNVIWQCRKCGTTLTVTASQSVGGHPSSNGCPKGGSHNWNRLSSSKVQ